MTVWTYKGVNVYPAPVNSSGVRWTANVEIGVTLRADTKQGMRAVINAYRGVGR